MKEIRQGETVRRAIKNVLSGVFGVSTIRFHILVTADPPVLFVMESRRGEAPGTWERNVLDSMPLSNTKTKTILAALEYLATEPAPQSRLSRVLESAGVF